MQDLSFPFQSSESKYELTHVHYQRHHHEKIALCERPIVLPRLLGVHVSTALDN